MMSKKIVVLFIIVYYFIFSILIFPSFYLNIDLTAEKIFSYQIYHLRKFISKTNFIYPQVKPSDTYTIILIGDSMTDYLRSGEKILRDSLKKYYPDKFIDTLNYGFGATNILSVKKRLTEKTEYQKTIYLPILQRKFDVIIIESFGNNPLSQYPLEKGLKIQKQALDNIVETIKKNNPDSIIIFSTSIAPNSKYFAKGVLKLSIPEKKQWVYERNAYIKNHIGYAKLHNIPLINIYEKSLDKKGDGDLRYISKNDYIHPSSEAIEFINRETANYIINQRFLPL